jgi:hypothetical protein
LIQKWLHYLDIYDRHFPLIGVHRSRCWKSECPRGGRWSFGGNI